MFIRYVLPLLAALGLGFALARVALPEGVQAPGASTTTPIHRLQEPTKRPPGVSADAICGAGLVEARDENVPIGTNLPGVVLQVPAWQLIGQHIEAGTELFRVDDRPYCAELKIREAALAAAEASLHRLENAPRAEDVPIAEAAVEESKATLSNTEIVLTRTSALIQRGAGSQSDLDAARFAHAAARANLAKTSADLTRLRRGSWIEDIEVARAQVVQARAQVESVKTDLERLIVRAPAAGEVLQVNVRPGQYAAVVWKEPLVVLGNDERLHVRVDVDEHDLPRFVPGASAIGFLRGFPDDPFPLEFVRVEPYVVPKKQLVGDNSERVDTRVLQVIYRLLDTRRDRVYVGQQMDVYIDGKAEPSEVR
jgi:multidrug resistance efflux pump